MSSRPGNVWNAVAMVATLALTAVVAVVAVTREDEPSAEPTTSPTPSPSPSATAPGELAGAGPFLVYSTSAGSVVAYDLDAGRATTLGAIETTPVIEGSRQPGDGRFVAFPTEDGEVWQVTRRGMTRVATIPQATASTLAGRASSPDGRRLATLSLQPSPALVLVDLTSGGITVKRGGFRGDSPSEPLLPVGWSLGGTIVYQLPFCRCPSWSPGLYAADLDASTISVVPGTRSDRLDRFVITQSGQSLLYGTEEAPFELKRVASGQRGADVLRESRDASLVPVVLSPDGSLMLLERTERQTGRTRFELAETDTGDAVARDVVSRIPAGARALALLPDEDVIVADIGIATGNSILLVRDDRTATLARNEGGGGLGDPVYLGWLR